MIMQAKRLLRQGCEAYLAHVVDTKKKAPSLEEVPIVKEFPEVFPDEYIVRITTRSRDRVYYELAPGGEPVSKAPYKMALVEMKGLAKQLQELLDKGMLRPSVSLWGAPALFERKKDGSMRFCIH